MIASDCLPVNTWATQKRGGANMDGKALNSDDLLERLDRLERRSRRSNMISAVLVLIISALVLLGQAGSNSGAKVIEAERFALKDSSGRPRASWGIGPTGALVLGFTDNKGKTRITLAVEPDGSPSLDVRGKDGRRKFSLFVFERDGTSV